MNAPDRIWACMDGPMVGLFVSGGINMGWPEYIRADLFAALEAEKAKAEAALAEAVEAAEELLHAVCSDTGFASCVRADTGRAYPWPAMDLAEDKLRALIAKIKEAKDNG